MTDQQDTPVEFEPLHFTVTVVRDASGQTSVQHSELPNIAEDKHVAVVMMHTITSMLRLMNTPLSSTVHNVIGALNVAAAIEAGKEAERQGLIEVPKKEIIV